MTEEELPFEQRQQNIKTYIDKMHARELRNYLITQNQPRPIDSSMIKKNNISYNLLPGTYGYITLNRDGTILIGQNACYDDVIAFLSFASRTSPYITHFSKSGMRNLVNKADEYARKQKNWFTMEENWFTWVDKY